MLEGGMLVPVDVAVVRLVVPGPVVVPSVVVPGQICNTFKLNHEMHLFRGCCGV